MRGGHELNPNEGLSVDEDAYAHESTTTYEKFSAHESGQSADSSQTPPVSTSCESRGGQSLENRGDEIVYQPLESNYHFRLLKLVQGQYESEVVCEICHFRVNWDTCPSYTAISYAWPTVSQCTNNSKDTTFYVAQHHDHLGTGEPHTKAVSVHQDILKMLRLLRHQSSNRWIWIDLICINQTSSTERSEQVKLMGTIYSWANFVVIYLEHRAKYEDTFNFIQTMVTGNSLERYRLMLEREKNADTQPPWRSMLELVYDRYWTRKWIIQEIAVAQSVVLQSGTMTCPLSDLKQALKTMSVDADAFKDRLGKDLIDTPAARTIRATETERPTRLSDLIPLFQGNECTNPRDHVYALYNLVGQHKRHLNVDYDRDCWYVYESAMYFMNDHEFLHPEKVIRLSILLRRLLQPGDPPRKLSSISKLFRVRPSWGYQVGPRGETAASQHLRWVELGTFEIMSRWLRWRVADWGTSISQEQGEPVGPHDLVHFTVTGEHDLYGLATCRLSHDTQVWCFQDTRIALLVRPCDRTVIVGSAYMYTTGENGAAKALTPSDHKRYSPLSAHSWSLGITLAELDLLARWTGTQPPGSDTEDYDGDNIKDSSEGHENDSLSIQVARSPSVQQEMKA